MIEDWQETLLRHVMKPGEAELLIREIEERKLLKETEAAMLNLRSAQAIASLRAMRARYG